MTRHGDARAANGHPPIYRIDLSLPPRERYVELSRLYRDELHSLTDLFDELVEAFLPNVPVKFIRGLARLALRRLFTTEETEEIRGISQAAGVDMYLLVAFNVLLDVLMGCTSGGVRVKAEDSSHTKMLHFRTLDWGMDALRKLIVQLEYVSSPDTDEILATSITYVGFVGVLTAVRKGLSVPSRHSSVSASYLKQPLDIFPSAVIARCRGGAGRAIILLAFVPQMRRR
ncbi:hypothetical protein T310_5891 [Rasamsonia emersonii CBS 393.64]|uniref:ceramidase n=1 Tax=Rasamsonia emersonii (strain ATCC 16479 / CBS 393.64 / IMI 116815) TaxID=1408163 RepID=A0A0F4YR80_RASE3|nr:hypothetical protein T310_5891 [Rasamsonia emersonii CBS 393.64]KKA20118.1 hypothetical protein T310_5891 [Rasamsonia emersonii CBS 393.64]